MPGVFIVDDVSAPGRPGTVNPVLLISNDGTATLVDAGFAGIAEKLSATLEEAGHPPRIVQRVIITHHHPDHTGGLAEVVAMTGAEVWAHRADADIIDGSAPRQASPGAPPGATSPHVPSVPVDLRLVGGERLEVLGGCEIMHTPGHTKGHLSLYLPAVSLLIAADVLRYENGTVQRAPEHFAADTQAYEASVRMLAELEYDHMLPYHGDFLGGAASTIVRRDLGLE
jgi:glyoxylase-like metal-dependent hydrolase (beta-lactamase superfamily II)